MPDTDTLAPFEGSPVRQAGIEIPGAAGGLREAMKIDPQEFHKGERVFIVLECVVGKVRFDPIDKTAPDGDQRRVHVLDVEGATIVDESIVREHLDAQAERLEAAGRARTGARTFDDVDLVEEHATGAHAEEGYVDACPECAAERAERDQ